MEFRKLISFGKSSFILSLPKGWVEKSNLKKGDSLAVDEKGKDLVISPGSGSEEKSEEVEVDITNLDRSSLIYVIRALYRRGFDIIKLIFNSPVCIHYRTGKEKKVISVIHEEVNRLSGMEIIQQKDNFCIIKNISEPTIKEFDALLRRIFLLLMDASNDLVTGAKNNDLVLIETIEEKHNSITKFVSYCLRLMNQKRFPDPKKEFFLYHTIASIDKITDVIKYAARNMLDYKNKMKKETISVMENTHNALLLYNDMFYKFNINKVKQFSESKESVKKNIIKLSYEKVPKEEMLMVSDMEHALEIILDLIETRISLEY